MKLTFKVAQKANHVYEYLSDMHKFELVHPIIHRIDRIEGNQYRVHERVKLGFLSYSFTYPVILITSSANKCISMTSTIMKLTEVRMNFTIREFNGYSIVEEIININSVLPVKKLMQRLLIKHHSSLFHNIEYT